MWQEVDEAVSYSYDITPCVVQTCCFHRFEEQLLCVSPVLSLGEKEKNKVSGIPVGPIAAEDPKV